MPRYLVRLQYLGTRYAGWQMQTNGTGVQQVVGEAMTRIAGHPVQVEGSGRTDAGVHADAQYFHTDLELTIPPRGLIAALNSRLPGDIRAISASEVPPAFHARFSARSKTYVYRIWNSEVPDVFRAATHAFVPSPLSLERMQQAGGALEAHHDFRSFTVADPEVSSTWRTISSLRLRSEGAVIELTVAADGFLRYMVRRIAGLLIEIGRGRLEPDYAGKCVEPEYAPARWTAPAAGLTLAHVSYEDETGSPISLC